MSRETKSQRKSLIKGHAGLSATEDLFFFLLHLCRVGQKYSGKESSVKDIVNKVTLENNKEAKNVKSR